MSARDPDTPRVKICGTTRLEDAELALDLGAWALGFIFYPPSPRAIEPDAARAIVAKLPKDALTVGVFVNRPVAEIESIVEHVGLRGVQLHGDESPEEVARVRAELVMKALRVGEGFRVEEAARYPDVLLLLDTYLRGTPGGTGETFDWSVAAELARTRDVVLAGGIGPDNVRAAEQAVRPYAINASSQLELSPGVKDPRQVERLFEALKSGE